VIAYNSHRVQSVFRPGHRELDPLTVHHLCFDAKVRIMPSRRYRKNAEECLDRAAQARKSEDVDAWLLIAEEWLRLAVEFDAAKQQSGTSPSVAP